VDRRACLWDSKWLGLIWMIEKPLTWLLGAIDTSGSDSASLHRHQAWRLNPLKNWPRRLARSPQRAGRLCVDCLNCSHPTLHRKRSLSTPAPQKRPVAIRVARKVANSLGSVRARLWLATVGAGADLSHMPIGDCAMANELRTVSGLNFGAFQPVRSKPGACLKSASAPTRTSHEPIRRRGV
jgi:hypothetical protein